MDNLQNKIPKEKEIVLAFFDILGSSKRLMNNEYQKVYEFYQYMVKLCSDTEVALSTPGAFHNIPQYDVLVMHPMHHAFFSDTFILWVEYREFPPIGIAGFYEKCSIIFIEALKKGIPLRGSIAKGTAIMDEENKLYLGKPLAEAAKSESEQQWLGVGLTSSIEYSQLSEMKYLFPYQEHIKQNSESLFNGAVLNWPRYFRETENCEPDSYIDKMNTDSKYSLYYEITNKFITFSKEHAHITKEIEDIAPSLMPLIVLRD